jgi:transcriptional regulator with XRE-family HTH domain
VKHGREQQFHHWLRTWPDDDVLDFLESVDVRFGEGVREARRLRGWSQRQLTDEVARVAGITLDSSAITRIEAGRRTASFKQAMALAVALDADSVEALIREPDQSPTDMAEYAAQIKLKLGEIEAEAAAAEAEVEWKRQQVAGHREQLAGVLDMLTDDERRRFDEVTSGE